MLLLETALASEGTIVRFFHGSEFKLLDWLLVAGLLLPRLNAFPAPLLAVFCKVPGILVRLPALDVAVFNGGVHEFADVSRFPILGRGDAIVEGFCIQQA